MLALLSAAATLSLPLVVAALVGTVQENKGLTWPALTMVGVGLGAALAGTLAAYLLSRLGERLICRLRIQTMRKSLDLRLSDARREGSGNLATRLTSDAMQLKGAIDIGPIQLPMALITLVGTLVIMGFLDWVLLLITMGGFTVAVGIIIAVIMGLRRKYGAMQENLGELTQQFVTALDALTIIKAYRAEDRVTRTLADRAEHLSKLGVQVARMESLMIPVINLGQQVALLTVLVGGGARLLSGELTLAEFVAFLLYLLQLTAPLILAASGASNVQAGLVARQRFSQLFTLPAENEDLETGAVAEAGAENVHPGTPAIQFEQVTFAYGDQPVLHGVDFTVPSSGLTAMVGLSGAGKSTILGLVEHFVTPESGQVRVFGQDTTRIPTDTLRSQIAYVDQSFTLLRDTIRANLSLGHSDLLPDEVLLPGAGQGRPGGGGPAPARRAGHGAGRGERPVRRPAPARGAGQGGTHRRPARPAGRTVLPAGQRQRGETARGRGRARAGPGGAGRRAPHLHRPARRPGDRPGPGAGRRRGDPRRTARQLPRIHRAGERAAAAGSGGDARRSERGRRVTTFSVLLPFMPTRPEHVLPVAALVQHSAATRLGRASR